MKHPSKILHLGCGHRKKKGAVGIDINPLRGVDIVHDLNVFPYPFKKNTFKEIVAEHILEHLSDLIRVMEEIHRIGQNGARLSILGPHFTSVDAFTDPTHQHFLTYRTFDYVLPESVNYAFGYSQARFKKIKIILGPDTSSFFLKLLLKSINRYPMIYEKRFAFIFPVGVIRYEFEVLK